MLSLFALVILFVRFPNILGADCKDPDMHCDLSNSTLPYFDIKQFGEYNGKWWVQKWYDHNETRKCMHMSFTVNQTNNELIGDSWSLPSHNSTKFENNLFYLRQPDPSKAGKFRMRTRKSLPDYEIDFSILGTDYETYLVVFMTDVNEGICNKFKDNCQRIIQILTAEQEPPYNVYDIAYQVADAYGLHQRHFWPTNTTNCQSNQLHTQPKDLHIHISYTLNLL